MNKRFYWFIIQSLCFVEILSISIGLASEIKEEFKSNPFINQSSIIEQKIEEPKEEFYIFGVGQGNSQLAIYERSGFAVLYDCGSSSQESHPKWDKFKTEDFEPLFYWKGKNELVKEQLKGISEEEDLFADYEPLTASNKKGIGEKATKKKAKTTKELIRETIAQYKIQHLFIFLSHSDKDHINYISDDIVPYKTEAGDLFVTAFLGGNWLRKWDEKKEDKLDTSIKYKVLEYLLNRKNTKVELPYYYSYESKNYPKNYHDIMQEVRKMDIDKLEKLFGKFSFYSSTFFEGSLLTLLQHTKNLRGEDYFINHLPNQWFSIPNKWNINRPYSVLDLFISGLVESPIVEDLKSSYILSMNYEGTDPNEQSTILAFTSHKLKMNFICTGDGNVNTFSKINPSFISTIGKCLKDETYINLLVSPHHGAEENVTPKVFELFRPSLFAFSSANGKQYGHPRTKVVEYYWNFIFSEKDYMEKINNRLAKAGANDNIILAFEGKGEDAWEANLIDNCPPFLLGTNILKTIRFNEEGIYSLFSNIISIDEGFNFKVNLVRRVEKLPSELTDLKSHKEELAGIFINKEGDKIFVPINNEDKDLFYEATKL